MQASLAALERERPDGGEAAGGGNSGAGAGRGESPAEAAAAEAAVKFQGRRVAVLQATKQDAVNIRERDRSLGGQAMHAHTCSA